MAEVVYHYFDIFPPTKTKIFDDFFQLLQYSKVLETCFQNLEGLVTQTNLFCWLYIAEMARV
jgi:hypothetical protein